MVAVISIGQEVIKNGKVYVQYHCNVCGYDGERRKDHVKNAVGCAACNGPLVKSGFNDVATRRADLIKYFKTESESRTLKPGSGRKITFKCPLCGYERAQRMADVSSRGFHCQICYGGMSFPSRVVGALLQQLNVDFVTEKTFEWAGRYRYDFYIPNKQIIIEVNGMQHYKSRKGWTKLGEIQRSDITKENLAGKNGILEYIVVNARKSETEYLKSKIIESGLMERLSVSHGCIDWCSVFSQASIGLAESALKYWGEGIRSPQKIAEFLNMAPCAIRGYLRVYATAGVCDYNPKETRLIGNQYAVRKLKKRTMCINSGEIFESASQAAEHYRIKRNALYECLRGKSRSAGKDSSGNKLYWKYI